MKRIFSAAAVLLIALACSSASAIPVATESFDYPNDNSVIHGRTGGFGWTQPWDDTDSDFQRLTANDTSLTVDSYPFPVSGDHVSGSAAGEAVRGFNGGIDLAQDGQVLFASLLMSKGNGGTTGDNVEFNLAANGSATGAIRFGGGSDEAFFLGSSMVTSAGAGRFMTPGQVYFMLLKVTSSAASPDLLQASFFGPGDSVPATEPVTWDLTNNLQSSSAVMNSVRLVTGANATGAFDELRIGFAYDDVAVFDPTFILGDFDGFNGLDPNDYLILRNNMFSGSSYEQGDFDGNGAVDLRDFIGFRETWNAQGLGAFPAAVPEPSTFALLAFGGLMGGAYYRRRGRR